MEAYYKDDLVTIHYGDALEVMKTFPENSIDTILTDPPYGLKFMGKDWDHGVPGVHYWAEALRVAKPGAFLLAFGGTRTFHRLTCAIEDAGWEIRDCIMWLYGSGFPKSHDISKAIDKVAGCERPRIAGGQGGSNAILGARKPGEAISGETIKWHGWGTALKPAWEPIVVAMKPLDKTFVNNALTWGVAGLNIDGCRISTDEKLSPVPGVQARFQKLVVKQGARPYKNGLPAEKEGKDDTYYPSLLGRWPANVILDEQAAELLDEQSGILTSGAMKKSYEYKNNGHSFGNPSGATRQIHDANKGGASRFFYTAKAAPTERGEDNNHPTVKPLDLMKYLCKLTSTPSGGVILDPFMGSGTTLKAAREMGRKSIGIDIKEDSCRIALKRLKQGVLNFGE